MLGEAKAEQIPPLLREGLSKSLRKSKRALNTFKTSAAVRNVGGTPISPPPPSAAVLNLFNEQIQQARCVHFGLSFHSLGAILPPLPRHQQHPPRKALWGSPFVFKAGARDKIHQEILLTLICSVATSLVGYQMHHLLGGKIAFLF